MATPGRVVGLDVGDVRIGVAVSDPLGIIATARTVIQRTALQQDIEALGAIIREAGATRVVVGMPLDQNGQPGPQAKKVRAFADQLVAALGVEIVAQDERFTTAAAERMLIAADVRRKGRKKVIDKVAAQHILQVYLDRQANLRKRAVP